MFAQTFHFAFCKILCIECKQFNCKSGEYTQFIGLKKSPMFRSPMPIFTVVAFMLLV